MPRLPHQTSPDKTRLITLAEIQLAMNWRSRDVRRSRQKHWWLWCTYERGRLTDRLMYDSQLIAMLRGIYGYPYDEVAAPGADWLTKFIKGDT